MNDVDQGHASFYHDSFEIAIDEKSSFNLWNGVVRADNLTGWLSGMDDGISQDDLNALFEDIQIEKTTTSPNIDAEIRDNEISQDDLNALFKEIQIETTQKPKAIAEVKDVETLDGGETLSQDQIDELLKTFLND